jgi:hypothetical protein
MEGGLDSKGDRTKSSAILPKQQSLWNRKGDRPVRSRVVLLLLCLLLAFATWAYWKSSSSPVGTSPGSLTKMVIFTVVGPEGRPVQGADVLVNQHSSLLDFRLLRTDDRGQASVELQQLGYWRLGSVLIHKPGLALVGGKLSGGTNRFQLKPSHRLSGVVADPAGRPVADAVVSLVTDAPFEPRFTVVSHADGRFAIPDLPADESAWIALKDPRFVHEHVEVARTDGAEGAVLIARPGALVRGRVIYDTGEPAPGVAVFAAVQDGQPRVRSPKARTITGDDGSFVLPGLDAGVYNVVFTAPSEEWIAAAAEGVRARTLEPVDVGTVVMTRGALIEGVATDAATGKPLPRVIISSYGPHRPNSTSINIGAHTDIEGRYRLRVAPGPCYVYVGGAPRGYQVGLNRDVQPKAGDVIRLDFAVRRDTARTKRWWKGWWQTLWPF